MFRLRMIVQLETFLAIFIVVYLNTRVSAALCPIFSHEELFLGLGCHLDIHLVIQLDDS